MLLKLTGEVLRVLEAQARGDLADGGTADEQSLGSLHDEAAYVGGGRIACQHTDEVAKVVGRQEELLRTVFHGGQAMLMLKPVGIILMEQTLETWQQVGIDGSR